MPSFAYRYKDRKPIWRFTQRYHVYSISAAVYMDQPIRRVTYVFYRNKRIVWKNLQCEILGLKNIRSQISSELKGTQDWEIFWLRFWNLRYFFVRYVKILIFYPNNFLIGPFLGEVRFFRVVLGLRGMKKNFELGPQKFVFLFQFWTLNMTQY